MLTYDVSQKSSILRHGRKLAFAPFAQKIQSSFNVIIGSLKRHYRYGVKKKKTCMELEFQNATIGFLKRHYKAPDFIFF